jgi:GTP cyclohydrolase I
MLNTLLKDQNIGDDHVMTNIATPLRPDAFEKNDEEKIEIIAEHFSAIMEALGLDLTDESLKGTPGRVAKMYVKEIFKGLNPENMPAMTLFDNNYQYEEYLKLVLE